VYHLKATEQVAGVASQLSNQRTAFQGHHGYRAHRRNPAEHPGTEEIQFFFKEVFPNKDI
jgi:hypothetical protein